MENNYSCWTNFLIICKINKLLSPVNALFQAEAIGGVEGTDTDSPRSMDSGGRPLVDHKDLPENSFVIKSSAKYHWFFATKVGETAKVFYDESDPESACAGLLNNSNDLTFASCREIGPKDFYGLVCSNLRPGQPVIPDGQSGPVLDRLVKASKSPVSRQIQARGSLLGVSVQRVS